MSACPGADLPLYLAGEMDAEARGRLLVHLKECAACRAESSELERITELLAAAPLEAHPPRGLEEEVLGLVAHLDAAELVRAAPLEGTPPDDLERRALQHAGALAEPPTKSRAAAVAFPALAVALLVLAAVGFSWRTEAGRMEDQFGPPGEELQLVSLGGPSPFPPGGGAEVKIVHYEHDDYGVVLEIAALPPCERESYYEVWLTGAPGRVSLGTFRVPGKEIYAFPLGIDPALFDRIQITREWTGGRTDSPGRTMWQASLNI